MKLTPDGSHVVYQTLLTIPAVWMAVDAGGNVYLASNNTVEKLDADGSTVTYNTTIGQNVSLTGIAVDSSGRAYVTGYASGTGFQTTAGALQSLPGVGVGGPNAFAVRLKPTGTVDYATYLGGISPASPAGIAVDASGSAFVTGVAWTPLFPTTAGAYLSGSGIPNSSSISFLARLSPDGSSLAYSTFTDTRGAQALAVALDPSDNADVLLANSASTASAILRFNPQGTAVLFSKYLPAPASWLAVDASGNTYVAVFAGANYPVGNSLATCLAQGTAALTVLDSSGKALQSTYIPGASGFSYEPPPVGLGNNSVYVVGSSGLDSTPTQQLAGSSLQGFSLLTSLTPNLNAPVVALACIGNAASYDSTGIAGGELVSLFGQGLGPATGTQPQVSLQTGFPEQFEGVQVTFNGTAGPLLYVQDGQINAIAPWALPSAAQPV